MERMREIEIEGRAEEKKMDEGRAERQSGARGDWRVTT